MASTSKVQIAITQTESDFDITIDFRDITPDQEDLEDLTLRLKERLSELEDVEIQRQSDPNPPEDSKSWERLIPGILIILIKTIQPNTDLPLEVLIPVIEGVQVIVSRKSNDENDEKESSEQIEISRKGKDGTTTTIKVNNQQDLDAAVEALQNLTEEQNDSTK